MCCPTARRPKAPSLASAEDLRRIALGLPGTIEAPHVDRAAFKVKRIYATMLPGAGSANLKFTPDEQSFKVMLAPELFRPLDNAWGKQGWTELTLAPASEDDLRAALEMAWAHAVAKTPKR
jgi:hypothetical protein